MQSKWRWKKNIDGKALNWAYGSMIVFVCIYILSIFDLVSYSVWYWYDKILNGGRKGKIYNLIDWQPSVQKSKVLQLKIYYLWLNVFRHNKCSFYVVARNPKAENF